RYVGHAGQWRRARPFSPCPFPTMLRMKARGRRAGATGHVRRALLLSEWMDSCQVEGRGMSSVSGRELELKLELTPEGLRRVGHHPALNDLTVGKPVTRTLRSIYFDTPDHRLRAQGISLRLRAIGDQWVQTIKGGQGNRTGVKHGVSNPDEVEVVVTRPE